MIARNILPILTTDGREAFDAITPFTKQTRYKQKYKIKNDKSSFFSVDVPIFHLPPLFKPTFRDVADPYLHYSPDSLLTRHEENEYFSKTLGITRQELQYLSKNCLSLITVSQFQRGIKKAVQNNLLKDDVDTMDKHVSSGVNSLIELRTQLSFSHSSMVSKRRCSTSNKLGVQSTDESNIILSNISRISHTSSFNQTDFDRKSAYDREPKQLVSELSCSLSNVLKLTEAIKRDIVIAQQLCRSDVGKHPRICAQLRGWSLQHFNLISQNILSSQLITTFSRWKQVMFYERNREKLNSYKQYQSVKIIWIFLGRRLWKNNATAWLQWIKFVEWIRHKEGVELRNIASQFIQKHWRGRVARNLLRKLQFEHSIQMSIRIQSIFRAKIAQKWIRQILDKRARVKISLFLQCAYRCRLSRRVLNKLQDAKTRFLSAILMQKILRGHFDRVKAIQRRIEKRRYICAAEIQRIVRGRIGMRKVNERKIFLQRSIVSILLQTRIRMFLCISRVKKMKEEEKLLQDRMKKSAVLVQRIFRGHRGRILVKLQKTTHIATIKRRKNAATCIQSFTRKNQAKLQIKIMKQEHVEKMILDASLWKETWSDESQAWYYYNEGKNESLWEPPITGYTKSDSKLVLKNGKIIEDPNAVLTEEEKISRRKERVCVDCEKALATRLCDQCGDKYCTQCYLVAHPKGGKRESHTFVRVGPIECEECSIQIASKWCTQCDDPFCQECWIKIHSKGKRSFHRYCNIDTNGNVSPRELDVEGNYNGAFSTEESEEIDYDSIPKQEWHQSDHIIENDGVDENHFINDFPIWSQYADENGIPYYHNRETGESTYHNPYNEDETYIGYAEGTSTQDISYVPEEQVNFSVSSNENNENMPRQESQTGRSYLDVPTETTAYNHLQQIPTIPEECMINNNPVSTNIYSNWGSAYDHVGNVYYFNHITGESTYDIHSIKKGDTF